MTLDPKNTIVIADFDGTLIKRYVDGKRVPSQASILEHDPKYLGDAGVAEMKRLYAQYNAIEVDPTVPSEEKIIFMQEWWEKCFDLFRQYHVTSGMIAEVCNSPLVQLRDGLNEFLAYIHQHMIPMIIYSANGIGSDSIQYLFQKHNLFTPNIRICSNELSFDAQGLFTHAKLPIITCANKTGETLIKNKFISQTPEKRHCLLIGDGLDDVRMTEGINFETVCKVAFGDIDSPAFKKRYDLILPIDAGFQPISALFDNS
ncbi:MAG: hypothetical protein WAV51_02400 [Microgenomates group bacterium]